MIDSKACLKPHEHSDTSRHMNRAASCCRIAWVAVWVALGAGCAGRGIPPQGASDRRAEGLTEEQTADPGAPPATAQGRTDGTEGTGAERDPHRTRRTLGWISLAIGAEAAIVAGVTSIMLLHEKSVLNDNCDARKVCSSDGIDAAGSISGLVPLNTTA